MNEDFPCDKCGCCCKRIYLIEGMSEYDRGDGVCKYLNDNNNCAIYEHRPDICNTRKYYERYYSKEISWKDFVEKCRKGCKNLQEINKL